MDHFEVRKYLSIRRHLILTCVSFQFLAEFRLEHGGKNSRPHGQPIADRHPYARASVASRRAMLAPAG